MRKLALCIASLLFPLVASAAATPFDFSTVGSNNTSLGLSVTVGDVKAEGFVIGGVGVNGGTYTAAPLWERNDNPDDHGLGVCSSGETTCSTGGGDVNELSNQSAFEAIRLTLAAGDIWTELWVSSLDSGGSNSKESGILYWSNSATNFLGANSFKFSYSDIANDAETKALLSLPAASAFDKSAKYLLFINDASNGTNNDYLVWGGKYSTPAQQTPEPGTLLLLGGALAGLALQRRKSA